MSSNALSTVLFPEPESPVRMTSWRASRLAVCFTGRGRSVFYPALVGTGDAHIFAIFCDGAAGGADGRGVEPFCAVFVGGGRWPLLFLSLCFFLARLWGGGPPACFP